MSLLGILVFYSPPALIALATAEGVVRSAAGERSYDWRASLASLADLLVRNYVVYVWLSFSLAGPLIGLAWRHRVATVPLGGVMALAVLFIGQEFCYYWFHRCSHHVRWLWASHAVHHSPNELNLSAAYRFGWTGRLAGGTLFFLPLVWLGFPPGAVYACLGLNLLYQFWLHTTWIPKLGPLEYVLNTPSHHRVHHAVNAEYLDRNFGGVLIVFDRLFGTFAAECAEMPCRYGLTEPLYCYNPFRIAFHEWIALARDLRRARDWRQCRQALLGPPRGAISEGRAAAVAAE
ncbi:MAG TPA: sterol desaturase family protein [Stellaceae bacterium]|nr:sterol desaturase family protein [Stellaceae bacterium]